MQVLHKAKERTPIDIAATYLGAHSVPKGSTAADYTQEILLRQLPTLKVRGAFPGVLSVRSSLFAPI